MSCSAILADETAKPDTTFKDQLLLRTYPGTERSSLPTAGMHDHIQIFQIGTNASHQTRDHPDMFPLHDVLEPANPLTNAQCVTNETSETCYVDKGSAHQQSTDTPAKKIWWSLTGSNRRPHACKARALPAELRPHYCASGSGPAQTGAAAHCLGKRAPSSLTRPGGPQGRTAAAHFCAKGPSARDKKWWAWEDLNFRPHAYQARALTN